MSALHETMTPSLIQPGQIMAVLVPVAQWNELLRQLETLQQRVAALEALTTQKLGYIPGNRQAAMAQLEAWRHEEISEEEQAQHRDDLTQLLTALEADPLTL